MSTSIFAEVEAKQKELFDRGYTQVSRLDKRQGDFNRLVDLANKRFGAYHQHMAHYFIEVPGTVVSHDMRFENLRRIDTPCAVKGWWCPEWMLAIVAYERDWRRDANRGIAQAYDHDEIVEVLHKGLCGDLDTVDAFMCLKELAIEAKREATGHSQRLGFEINGQYFTLNEIRNANGLPELP